MDMHRIREFSNKGLIMISEHADMRLQERNISIKEIVEGLNKGEIIENYDEDEPFPSCLILYINNKKPMHIVVSDAKDYMKIVTAYIPNKNIWYDNYKKRLIV